MSSRHSPTSAKRRRRGPSHGRKPMPLSGSCTSTSSTMNCRRRHRPRTPWRTRKCMRSTPPCWLWRLAGPQVWNGSMRIGWEWPRCCTISAWHGLHRASPLSNGSRRVSAPRWKRIQHVARSCSSGREGGRPNSQRRWRGNITSTPTGAAIQHVASVPLCTGHRGWLRSVQPMRRCGVRVPSGPRCRWRRPLLTSRMGAGPLMDAEAVALMVSLVRA